MKTVKTVTRESGQGGYTAALWDFGDGILRIHEIASGGSPDRAAEALRRRGAARIRHRLLLACEARDKAEAAWADAEKALAAAPAEPGERPFGEAAADENQRQRDKLTRTRAAWAAKADYEARRRDCEALERAALEVEKAASMAPAVAYASLLDETA